MSMSDNIVEFDQLNKKCNTLKINADLFFALKLQ